MFENSRKMMKTLFKSVVFGSVLSTFPGAVEGSVNPLLAETSAEPSPDPATPPAIPPAETTPVEQGQSSEAGTEQAKPDAQQTEPKADQQTTEKPSETVQPNILKDLGLDKFKDIAALGNSYKHIEQLHSRTANENAELKKQIAELKAQQDAKIQQEQVSQKPEPTPEQTEEENNKLIEQLMNDPRSVIERLRVEAAEQAKHELESIKQQVEPIIEKSKKQDAQERWNQLAAEFSTAVDPAGNLLHPEIKKQEVRDAMVQAYNRFPGLLDAENGLETAYKYALGELNDTVGSVPAIDPQSLLDDEEFLKQAAANPKIIEMATQKYLETIKQGSPPVIMGKPVGSAPAAIPETKPKTIAESSRAFLKSMGW